MKPILFNTDMIRSILSDGKDVTRRLNNLSFVNQDPDGWEFDKIKIVKNLMIASFYHTTNGVYYNARCPFYDSDMILWVRETFAIAFEGTTIYKADDCNVMKWKPSIYMPKSICRLFLQIKSIQIERLNDITIEDCIREGIPKHKYAEGSEWVKIDFMCLWDRIYKKKGFPAASNPWVWRIEFERIKNETSK